MERSEHDPASDEGTPIVDDGLTLDGPTHSEEASPRTERMLAPQAEPPRWNKTLPIAGGPELKATVRSAGDALARLPADAQVASSSHTGARLPSRSGDTQLSPGLPRRLEPEPPTMRRPERRRRGPYVVGALVCILGGGVVASLWPSEGVTPPPAATSTVRAPTVSLSPSPPPAATVHAPPTPSLPLVEGAGTGDGSDLAPYQGYLVVRSPARADVFEGQTSRGPTNRKLVLRCRDYTLRLRDVHTQRWLSDARTVSVSCQKITTVVVTPEAR